MKHMIIVNTKTNLVHENANFTQAGIITGIEKRIIAKWAKSLDYKEYGKWRLYFKVIRLKKGILGQA